MSDTVLDRAKPTHLLCPKSGTGGTIVLLSELVDTSILFSGVTGFSNFSSSDFSWLSVCKIAVVVNSLLKSL